jgi:branched-subunit amino acid ABC-type transport system permease component
VNAGGLVVAVDGIAYGMVLFLAAAGLSLTLGVAHTLNLAHGSVYLLGAYLAWQHHTSSWAGIATAAVLAVALGAVVGAGVGAVLQVTPEPLRQVLASVGVALIAGHVLTAVYGAEPRSVDPPSALGGTITLAGRPYPVYRLALIIVAAGLAVLLWWLLRRTRAGVLMRAAGADPELVAIAGVDPRTVQLATAAAGGLLAALAGVLSAPLTGPAPGLDHSVLLLSLTVVILGGPGSMTGALTAALFVGQIRTTGIAFAPTVASYLPHVVLATALVARAAIALHRARTA